MDSRQSSTEWNERKKTARIHGEGEWIVNLFQLHGSMAKESEAKRRDERMESDKSKVWNNY